MLVKSERLHCLTVKLGEFPQQNIYGSDSPKRYQPQVKLSVKSIGHLKFVSKVCFLHDQSDVRSLLRWITVGQQMASVHIHLEGINRQLLLAVPWHVHKRFGN